MFAAYVNTLRIWGGDGIAEEIGATNPRGYNTILLAYWRPNQYYGSSNPVDVADLWYRTTNYFGPYSRYGTTDDQIRRNLVYEYHRNGVKVLISAFGSTYHPTSRGISATACGESLAQFVIENHLHGRSQLGL